ncbi:MAG: SOS response-associated peptidase [Sphingobacteriales bacterium]|nr:MAG: SOS response-associated peptidase [Sphingobacteriales bacterium]
MCYHLSRPSAQALREAGLTVVAGPETTHRLNGFDHPELPATVMGEEGQVRYLEWGLIPSWIKGTSEAQKAQNSTLNARSETMFEKPMFREAARHHRCLLWANGFYEWQHRGKEKIPYFLHLESQQLFTIAGLMSEWAHPETGELLATCSLLTTEANPLMAEIHNSKLRMPLILPEAAHAAWLAPDSSEEAIMDLCRPLADGFLQAELLAAPPAPPAQTTLF